MDAPLALDGPAEKAISKQTFHKFIPLIKADEAQRIVYGVVTAETPDQENEVCDYATTVPYYKALNDKFAKATNGKSICPLREMHQLSAVGTGQKIDFDDAVKTIRMAFKVVDDVAWKKVQEGVYTGFSQGGDYVKTWKVGSAVHYTADPKEISLVDNPCLAESTYEYIKADGATELRKFIRQPKRIDKTGLATFLSKQNVKPLVAVKALTKGMYDVQDVASAFSQLAWCQQYLADEKIYEADDSAVPDKLLAVLRDLQTVLLELVQEETDELLARASAGEKAMHDEELKKAQERLAKVKSAHDHITKAMEYHGKMAECMGKAKECLGTDESDEAKKAAAPVVEKTVAPVTADVPAVKTLTLEEVTAVMKAHTDALKKELTPAPTDATQKVKVGLFGRDGQEVTKAVTTRPTENLQDTGF